MKLTSLTLKDFRCFESQKIAFDEPIIVIEGPNGSGKTSILEALHYACYLRSFRTHIPKEMIQFNADAFSVKLEGQAAEAEFAEPWSVHIGLSGKERRVKINDKVATSYKQLFDYYRSISIIEDDLMLIKGAPELRRTFMDQAIFLFDPSHAERMRNYRKILKQRNALFIPGRFDKASYDIWTEQLIQVSQLVQKERRNFLQNIETEANKLLLEHFASSGSLQITYTIKKQPDNLMEKERAMHRSLFGAHLDDATILYHDRQSKNYASRGQQKLVAMILKIAQLKLLGKPATILIDDFMTDFDEERIEAFLNLLTSGQSQLIFTCPLSGALFTKKMNALRFQAIKL